MLKPAKQLVQFIRDVAGDERIPQRDKKVILALLALVISPIDLIPDWIPIIGLLDDLVMLGLILDYFFRIVDQQILLSHFPWGMKSYLWVRRFAAFTSWVVPDGIKQRIWSFESSPYRKM